LIVARNQVAGAEMPNPIAAALARPGWCWSTPWPSSLSHSASNASGSTATCDNTNATNIKRGSWRYPSLHRRHMDENAGGSSSIDLRPSLVSVSGEVVIHCSFLIFGSGEPLCLKVEHR